MPRHVCLPAQSPASCLFIIESDLGSKKGEEEEWQHGRWCVAGGARGVQACVCRQAGRQAQVGRQKGGGGHGQAGVAQAKWQAGQVVVGVGKQAGKGGGRKGRQVAKAGRHVHPVPGPLKTCPNQQTARGIGWGGGSR